MLWVARVRLRNMESKSKLNPDCTDNKCKINVSEEQYVELKKEFTRILIPTPEQRNPKSWTMATERKTLDELMEVVKEFIVKRLSEFVVRE